MNAITRELLVLLHAITLELLVGISQREEGYIRTEWNSQVCGERSKAGLVCLSFKEKNSR